VEDFAYAIQEGFDDERRPRPPRGHQVALARSDPERGKLGL
jgi:hypothetical protein